MDPKSDIAPPSGVATTPRKSWWDDFKNPVNLIGWGLAVISIALTVYLYFKNKESRELSLHVLAITKVYDSTSTSRKLSVVDSENKHVTNDVYVASYQLWNSGTLPVEPADLRRPFTMRLVGNARLLDWSIPYCITNPDVCDFHFEASDTNTSPRSVTLKWQHFDPQHGCQFQLLYAGSADGGLSIESPFTGNGRIVEAIPGLHLKGFGFVILVIVTVVPTFFISTGIQRLMKRRKVHPTIISLWEGFAIYVIGVLIALGLMWVLYQNAPKSPFPPNVPVSFKSPVESGSQQEKPDKP